MKDFFQGSSGSVFRINAGINISGANPLQLKLLKPDGATAIKDITSVITGGYIARYTTLTGDLNVTGVWEGQLYAKMPLWENHGKKFKFTVNEKLF